MRTILTVAVALLVTTAAIAQDKASQKFIIEAIQGNFAEINMGQLAGKNGHEASVITYGQTLITDHGNANQKAQQAANAIGITSPPTGPNAKQKSCGSTASHQSKRCAIQSPFEPLRKGSKR